MSRLGWSFSNSLGYKCPEDERETWAGFISMCRAAKAKNMKEVSQEE